MRKVVGFKIDTSIHRKLKHLAIDAGFDVSELAEVAIRLLIIVATEGIPEGLKSILTKKDPTLLEKLRKVAS